MEDQQNVGSSWDKENHSSKQNNNGSHSGNHDEKKARRLNKWRTVLQKRLATMGHAFGAMVNARRTVLKQAERIGRLLLPIKAAVGHGKWQQWLVENTTIDGRQLITDKVARNWMAIARNRELLKAELNSDLNITEALRLIQQHRTQAKLQSKDEARQKVKEIEITVDSVASEQTIAPEVPSAAKLIAEPARKVIGMYSASVKQWNPYAGCGFACAYCGKSFQLQLKRQKHNCTECYDYEPHSHPERLDASLPRTGPFEFIFTCSHGDISFCDDEYFGKILARITKERDKTFLLQSKSPKKAFDRPGIKLPHNVIAGTTLETNRADLCRQFTSAPPPELRFRQLRDLEHPSKMVTIEPILAFDLDVMVQWIADIRPKLVWLGYDSKNCGLVEPTIAEFQALVWELAKLGVAVILKKTEPNIPKDSK